MIASEKALHYSFGTKAGWGSAGWKAGKSYHHDKVIVLAPEVGLETNLGQNLRIQLTVSYRFVQGLSLTGMSKHSLNSPSVNFTLHFTPSL